MSELMRALNLFISIRRNRNRNVILYNLTSIIMNILQLNLDMPCGMNKPAENITLVSIYIST